MPSKIIAWCSISQLWRDLSCAIEPNKAATKVFFKFFLTANILWVGAPSSSTPNQLNLVEFWDNLFISRFKAAGKVIVKERVTRFSHILANTRWQISFWKLKFEGLCSAAYFQISLLFTFLFIKISVASSLIIKVFKKT